MEAAAGQQAMRDPRLRRLALGL
ncbi:MAG: hypothetical protein RL519_582, partial [Pseudomonadota bacterium]